MYNSYTSNKQFSLIIKYGLVLLKLTSIVYLIKLLNSINDKVTDLLLKIDDKTDQLEEYLDSLGNELEDCVKR